MAKTSTTSTDGEAASGEVQAHVHHLPTPDSAVSIGEGADGAPGKTGSADSQRRSEDDMDGSRKSYRQRRSRYHKELMALFEITDSESDASDVPVHSPEEDDCSEIADAAAAKSDEDDLMPLDQPAK
eukprot:7916789-Pyramimonas_sp.AAC.1